MSLSLKWQKRFLDLATQVGTWSLDPSTGVGAVVVSPNKRIVGLGYNGFPDRIPDRLEWLEDREIKLSMMIHAEVNAILNATASVQGCDLFVSRPPCGDCAKFVVQAGIRGVYSAAPDLEFQQRWGDSLRTALRIFGRASVPLVLI